MNYEQLDDMIVWLNQQIEGMGKAIHESQHAGNYGKKAEYEGMREAFIRCVKKLIA